MPDKPSKFILSINAGSSSLKLSLYSASFSEAPKLLISSSIANIKSPPATFSYENLSAESSKVSNQSLDHVTSQDEALECFLQHMASDKHLPVRSSDDIDFVCHRIVHGGDFKQAMVLSKETIQEVASLTELAPLYVYSSTKSFRRILTPVLKT